MSLDFREFLTKIMTYMAKLYFFCKYKHKKQQLHSYNVAKLRHLNDLKQFIRYLYITNLY